MSKTKHRRFTAAFKTKVCLEALKERETIEALAKKYDIHPNQINAWKRVFISKSETVFEKSTDPGRESKEKLIETLYSRIGQLSVDNDFLKIISVKTLSDRKAMIETIHQSLSIAKQCGHWASTGVRSISSL